MTKRVVTDYEVEQKEVTKTKYECDVEGCFAEVDPVDITTVNYEHAKSDDESVTEKHLCPEHTDVPELVEIKKHRKWIRAVAKGLGEVSMKIGLPVFVFIVTAWGAFFIGGMYALAETGAWYSKLFGGVIIWMFCALLTVATLDEP